MKQFKTLVNVLPGEFDMGDERWRKDEILAAKIKKFLSVS